MIDNSLPEVETISNAFRDPSSGAVVIDDHDNYLAAKKRKSLHERQLNNEEQIRQLQDRVARMDSNLEKLVNLLT